MSPSLVWVLRFVTAFLLLIGVAWFVDLKAAVQMLKRTDWRWILLAVAIVQVQIVVSAWRWHITARRLGQTLSLGRAISEYYLATMANLSLPGGVAGDAGRVVRNRENHGWGTAAQAVILERLSGQIALFLVALSGWTIWMIVAQQRLPDGVGQLLMIIGIGVVSIVAVAVVFIHFAAERVTGFIVGFGPAIHRTWISERQWMIQGVLSLAVVGTYLSVFAVSALAVGEPLPVIAIFTIVPFVLLSMVVPVSIGGWGIREATAASIWPLLGLSAESGVAASVVYGLVSLFGALPGVLWLVLFKRRGR